MTFQTAAQIIAAILIIATCIFAFVRTSKINKDVSKKIG